MSFEVLLRFFMTRIFSSKLCIFNLHYLPLTSIFPRRQNFKAKYSPQISPESWSAAVWYEMLFYELVNLFRFCKIFYNRKIWQLIFAKSLMKWFCTISYTSHENMLDLQSMKLTFWSVERKVTIFSIWNSK